MIGRSSERWSGISVLVAQHDDDNDIYIWFIYIYIWFIYIFTVTVSYVITRER